MSIQPDPPPAGGPFEQKQFLQVVDVHEAERILAEHARVPRVVEWVSLAEAAGKVLANQVQSGINVPGFDRSNFDGFAVRAEDLVGASEHQPIRLKSLSQRIAAGPQVTSDSRTASHAAADQQHAAAVEVVPGSAIAIATGGPVPRGADAVVMVEDTRLAGEYLEVCRAVPSGWGIAFAGSDICFGQIAAYGGSLLTSRELGTLAAIGCEKLPVWRPPRVAILSTGDELVRQGQPLQPGQIYDSNGPMLVEAVRECGGHPQFLGIAGDDPDLLRDAILPSLERFDMVLLSGGTSKGQGDLCFQIVNELRNPGVLVHGVAIKPGKPICLAVENSVPLAVLPGFPTSAIFTFHQFLAPLIRQAAGLPGQSRIKLTARLSRQIASTSGRTEYNLVQLIANRNGGAVEPPGDGGSTVEPIAVPLGHGSGSVTTFSQADGFLAVDKRQELVPAGTAVEVTLLSEQLRVPDLVVAGSHCQGVEFLVSRLQQQGLAVKSLFVGSTEGLQMLRRGEADLCGLHLMDDSGQYNLPFLRAGETTIFGYARKQGLLVNTSVWQDLGLADDASSAGPNLGELISRLVAAKKRLVNRNRGSGTRVLIDRLLAEAQVEPAQVPGYSQGAVSHHAVVAAINQGRADWGIAIEAAVPASLSSVQFVDWGNERYDWVTRQQSTTGPAMASLRKLIASPEFAAQLEALGCRP